MSQSKFDAALAAIDAAHAEDPNKIDIDAHTEPYELHYAKKMTAYLNQRSPQAHDLLRLAIRAQHFRRWEIPRSSYPMTRPGYYSWRTFLKKRQAELVAQICLDVGYSQDDADRVGALVRKEDLKVDQDTQVLEDVACLVFLDDQFEDFEKSHDEDKIIGILRKTWVKMTPEGQRLAMAMKMEGRPAELLQKALNG